MRSYLQNKAFWSLILIIIATVAATLRLLWIVNRYTVNLFFSDQWGSLTPFFEHADMLTVFRWANLPHRQGLGSFVIWAVIVPTRWNARALSFVMVLILLGAALAALALKYRLTRKWTITDAILPLLVLAPIQWEHLITTPNPAHSILPLLLVMLTGIVWTLPRLRWRYALVLVCDFFCIYTGFGFFMGLLTPVLFAIILRKEYQQKNAHEARLALAGLSLSLLALASFFVGYHFSPATKQFAFVHPKPLDYLRYMALVAARACSFTFPKVTVPFGLLLLLVMVVVLCYRVRHWLVKDDVTSQTIALLLAFALLFLTFTAYGRVGLGFGTAYSSRYTTLPIVGWVGLYLHFVTLPGRSKASNACFACLFVLWLWSAVPFHFEDWKDVRYHYRTVHTWKQTYLRTGSIALADRAAASPIFPRRLQTQLQAKLDYLQRNRLNLFAPSDSEH